MNTIPEVSPLPSPTPLSGHSSRRPMSLASHCPVVNFSTAQHKFSFGTSRRFPLVKPTTPTDFTVKLGSTLQSRRSPTFGKGDRFRRPSMELNCVPPPNQYTIKTSFEGHSPTIKGNTLTTSFQGQANREAFANVYMGPGIKSIKASEDIPGPGAYSYANMAIGTDTLKYTLKSRCRNTRGKAQLS